AGPGLSEAISGFKVGYRFRFEIGNAAARGADPGFRSAQSRLHVHSFRGPFRDQNKAREEALMTHFTSSRAMQSALLGSAMAALLCAGAMLAPAPAAETAVPVFTPDSGIGWVPDRP